jgi:hypothetical protein
LLTSDVLVWASLTGAVMAVISLSHASLLHTVGLVRPRTVRAVVGAALLGGVAALVVAA